MKIKPWYSSSEAKRKLGALAQRLNETGERVGIDGNPDAPRFFLQDVDDVDLDGGESAIGVDMLRAHWPDKLREIQRSGAKLVVNGSRTPRAVLTRNEALMGERKRARQTATRREVRELTATMQRLDELSERLDAHMRTLSRIEERIEVFDRRFVELWRANHDASS